jgi:hypothetical protein
VANFFISIFIPTAAESKGPDFLLDNTQISTYYQRHATTPAEFAEWKAIGEAMGFKHVESSPLTRSSYHARQQTESGASQAAI